MAKTEWKPTQEQLDEISRLAGLGLSVADIAARFNYGTTQFMAYVKTNPEVSLAMAQGRSVRREDVAQRLLERALEDGEISALIWWEKSRYNMGETVNHSIQGGGEDSPPIKVAPDAQFVRDVLLEVEKAYGLRHSTDMEGDDQSLHTG